MSSPDAQFGQLSCSCHPSCGASAMLARNRRTKDWAPVSAFFDIEQFMKDIDVIVDSGRGRALSFAQIGLSFLRNFDERKAPPGLTLARMLQLFRSRLLGGKKRPTEATRPGIGSSSGSAACGSRTCGPTTSAAPRCA